MRRNGWITLGNKENGWSHSGNKNIYPKEGCGHYFKTQCLLYVTNVN